MKPIPPSSEYLKEESGLGVLVCLLIAFFLGLIAVGAIMLTTPEQAVCPARNSASPPWL